MVENWLGSLNNNCPDGYDVREEPGFLIRVQDVIGSIPHWDEIRRIHDLALSRDPHIGEALYGTDLWMRRIDYRNSIYVLYYTIDEDNCRVLYQDLRQF